jgi:predicted ATPase
VVSPLEFSSGLLYLHGLQRNVPAATALILTMFEVVDLDGGIDYRLR